MKSLLSGLGRPVIADHPGIESLSALVGADDLPVLASYPDVREHRGRPRGSPDRADRWPAGHGHGADRRGC